jgi:hypothetical protein
MAPLQPDGDSFKSVPMQSFQRAWIICDNALVPDSVTPPPAGQPQATCCSDVGSVPVLVQNQLVTLLHRVTAKNVLGNIDGYK